MSDTIAAIATPLGEGGVGVLRLSGEGTEAIVQEIFHLAGKKKLIKLQPRRVYFGKIIDPKTGSVLDEVLLTLFKAPHSFTCEDVAEIGAHGGMYVVSRILQLMIDRGARLAEPGEFTKRAFLNGRLDLSQAEAVADIISAASERALQSALGQLQGHLSKKINQIYDRLIATLAQLETAIDFPEDGLEFNQREKLQAEVTSVLQELNYLAGTWRQGKIFREGIRATLTGKPNVGKSSLLNALLKENRAIVTPHPGTTRDLLEERIRIKDIHVVFTDSAGFHSNPEPIEAEGIARARSALQKADLVILLFDGSEPLDQTDYNLIRETKDKQRIAVVNKSDLPEHWSIRKLALGSDEIVRVSAKQGNGMDNLLETIHDKMGNLSPETVVVTRERHRYQIVKASDSLAETLDSLQNGLSEEFIATDIQIALNYLGTILGKTFEDDLLDQIFREFCIGK